jgi:pantothenate kinase type III
MLTAIDIGNTYIKAGVFHNDELKEVNIVSNINSIPSTYLSSENDFAICSVVP